MSDLDIEAKIAEFEDQFRKGREQLREERAVLTARLKEIDTTLAKIDGYLSRSNSKPRKSGKPGLPMNARNEPHNPKLDDACLEVLAAASKPMDSGQVTKSVNTHFEHKYSRSYVLNSLNFLEDEGMIEVVAKRGNTRLYRIKN
jgi:DNA-binding PadR family transcriptional regulator